ncbi:MAG: oleate hydratase, partial [Bradyrhizobium sp.]
TVKAHFIGGGIGSLAAAAFMVRDAKVPGANISIYEAASVLGGALDGAGNATDGYRLRGGRMLTSDNYECVWDLFKTIPSLESPSLSVFEETMAFNKQHVPRAQARLVDRNCHKTDVTTMGFSMADRLELVKITEASEERLGADRITDWLSPPFFDTNFWFMWQTTFAFQPWHSAVEFKRYLHRFMLEFTRIETLAGVKRTKYNQYDSLVRPLVAWLETNGVHFIRDCAVTDFELEADSDTFVITVFHCNRAGKAESVAVAAGDLVFFQNGSMVDASSFGTMSSPAKALTKVDSGGWSLWEKLAEGRPEFGRPAAFNSHVAESCWHSFTVTLKDTAFFDHMEKFSGNEAGIGGLVTFFQSNWLMSIVLYHQPHFPDQPDGVQVFWGYALHPDRIGNFVAKPLAQCSGKEILIELCGHLNLDTSVFESAICIPCRMPYITSMFMPRAKGDRPQPVPANTKNFAMISQFVEIPVDVVFTVEYSVRVAQTVVYQLLGVDRQVTPITAHDKSIKVQIDSVIKAFA